ncbi:MAG TPA: type II toxin-antitoxin system VapC family toxin [Luteolibacter sp.]
MNPVLVDTGIWIKHFRQRNPLIVNMLEDGEVWCHPIVVGELSMGSLKNRPQTIFDLSKLNRPPIATFAETRQMVEARRLWGRGVQWNDARILASAILGQVPLWTADIRLGEIARELGVGFGA